MITRATEPHSGKLALPGGMLRYGEDPAEGARRETFEETLFNITIDRLLCATLVDYLYLATHVCVLELAYLASPVNDDPRGRRTVEARDVNFYNIDRLASEPSLLAFPEQLRAIRSYSERRMSNPDNRVPGGAGGNYTIAAESNALSIRRDQN